MAESDLVEAKLFLRGGLSINHAAREEWEEGFSKMCTIGILALKMVNHIILFHIRF